MIPFPDYVSDAVEEFLSYAKHLDDRGTESREHVHGAKYGGGDSDSGKETSVIFQCCKWAPA